MTQLKHAVRFCVVFDTLVPQRQVNNMCPTLAGYGTVLEEAPRSFRLETQAEGKRKAVIKILMDWQTQGLVRWEKLT
jgi:hypothetical protein